MSSTAMGEVIVKVLDGRAFIGLATMQAAIARADGLTKRSPDDMSNQDQQEIESILGYSYQTFIQYLKAAFQFYDHQRYGRFAIDFPREFEEMRKWISSGFEHLSELRKLQPFPNFPSDLLRWHKPFISVLVLTGRMLPQHLSSWLMLSFGEAAFVLGSINGTYKAATNHLFDAAMFALKQIIERFEAVSDPCNRGQYFVSDEVSRLYSNKQIPDCFKLIQKLLDLGLNPNARAETFTVYNYLWEISQMYPLSSDATNWQRFLGRLDWLGCPSVGHMNSADIYMQVLSLSTQFLSKGADAHAMILISIDLRGPASKRSFRHRHLLMEQSAAHILHTFMLRTGCTDSVLKEYLGDYQVVQQWKCKELWESVTSLDEQPKKALRYFTDEQHSKIGNLTEAFWELHRFGDRMLEKKLDEASEQVWTANSEHVSEGGQWEWWVRSEN